MTDTRPRPRRSRAVALFAGTLAAVVLAMGFGAIAFASGRSLKPRPPAVTGNIHLNLPDDDSCRTVRGEVVFENHTSQTKVLMRRCTIDGLFAIGFRASDGYLQEPAFSLVGCIHKQEMVGRQARHHGVPIQRPRDLHGVLAARQPPAAHDLQVLDLRCAAGTRAVSATSCRRSRPAGTPRCSFPGGEWHGPHVRSADPASEASVCASVAER
jgi:hypothetical protein